MTKGKWFARALHVTIALSFILGALVVAPSVSADPGTSKWEKQGTPTHEDKVILPGSDIIDFDVTGPDGMTIYAIGTLYDLCNEWWDDAVDPVGPAGGNGPFGPMDLFWDNHFPKLWKSTDGGVTWSDKTSKVLAAKNLPDLNGDGALWSDFTFFTAVSAAPDDPDFVVVTGWGYDAAGITVADIDPGAGTQAFTYHYIPVVVGSNDGAGKFYYMGCSTVTGMITCVDVSMELDDKHVIAVGTWDWEAQSPMGPVPLAGEGYLLDNASVWRYDAGGYWSAYWANTTSYTGWAPCDAVVDVEISPNFDVDDTVLALCIGDVNDSDVNMGDDDTRTRLAIATFLPMA